MNHPAQQQEPETRQSDGQIEGCEEELFKLAVDCSRGARGRPRMYQKGIELFEKLLLIPSTYDRAAFFLAGMYLKGKTDDSRKDRADRKRNLSDVPTADIYAGLIKCPKLKQIWKYKKDKYIPTF